MDSPSPPPIPDPVKTAKAQTASNKATAITQAQLNNYDQIGPDGNKTYQQTGTYDDGTPKFTQTTTLSAPNQQIYDTNLGTKQNIAQIGKDQSAKIGSLLGTNINLDNDATEARLFDLGSKRLDPMFARNEDALRTRLTNQGIQPGSAAWNAEMTQFQQGKNDAFDQLALTGRGQAVQEALTERNQPINEISALMSGSQVSQPTFSATPSTGVAGTDVAGITQNAYNAANQQYQTQMSQNNAAMGGMFGLGGTVLGGAMKYGLPLLSDRRAKTDIRRVGKTDSGIPIYTYRYRGSDVTHMGVMADEVPDHARVVGDDGLFRVYYDRVA